MRIIKIELTDIELRALRGLINWAIEVPFIREQAESSQVNWIGLLNEIVKKINTALEK